MYIGVPAVAHGGAIGVLPADLPVFDDVVGSVGQAHFGHEAGVPFIGYHIITRQAAVAAHW